MKKNIEIQLFNGEITTGNITSTTVRRGEFNIISRVTIELEEKEQHLAITTSHGKTSITLYKPSSTTAYNHRLEQHSVTAITVKDIRYTPQQGLAALNRLVNSLVPANNNSQSEQVICKTTEIMTASFMNELTRLGYVISEFTQNQREKLSSSLIEFITKTGDTFTQKRIFDNFVSYIRKGK